MARYIQAIDLPIPIEEAFDYLADFNNTAEWDPGVGHARKVTAGPVRLGSRFSVGVSFFGVSLPFEYRITAFEPPSRIVLAGGDESIRSIDEITFVSRPGGTRVTYEARLELAGVRRLFDPALQLIFQPIGDRAARGLRERFLERRSPSGPSQGARSDARIHPIQRTQQGEAR